MRPQNAKGPISAVTLPGQSSTNQLDDGMKNFASTTTNRDELLAVRQKLEAGLEYLVALLDEIDGEADREDDGTGEPVLGWPLQAHPITNDMTCDDDREEDDEREDDKADSEPWLGRPEDGHDGQLADTDLEVDYQ
ncbi:hypothetical protein [Martelella limonii]|uniref:hypothetical protein n=1 Tax=Martelella limonii TaxID=1647649 RepID=UPI001580DCB8|nr:hypothetical protein [Martelella limonii]